MFQCPEIHVTVEQISTIRSDNCVKQVLPTSCQQLK